MSFGFIQLFFFITLGIVLGLILLLCYYLKNKIDVLDKQYVSFRDILSSLIKEIKHHFQEHEKQKVFSHPKLIPIKEEYGDREEGEGEGEGEEDEDEEEEEDIIMILGNDLSNNSITMTINIDDDEEDDHDYENEYETLTFGNDEEDLKEIIPELIESSPSFIVENALLEEIEQFVVEEIEQFVVEEIEPPVVEEIEEHVVEEIEQFVVEEIEEPIQNDEVSIEDTLSFDKPFRKMNLNQLKQYALAQNLATYVHKMKKDELLKLIEENKSHANI